MLRSRPFLSVLLETGLFFHVNSPYYIVAQHCVVESVFWVLHLPQVQSLCFVCWCGLLRINKGEYPYMVHWKGLHRASGRNNFFVLYDISAEVTFFIVQKCTEMFRIYRHKREGNEKKLFLKFIQGPTGTTRVHTVTSAEQGGELLWIPKVSWLRRGRPGTQESFHKSTRTKGHV